MRLAREGLEVGSHTVSSCLCKAAELLGCVAEAVRKELFLVEREAWGKPPEEVDAARQARSWPLVDGLYAWMKAMGPIVRPGSTLARAFTYAMNQEAELRCFLDNPQLPMHDNLSELMLRQAVFGRKNWLFARSEGGAKAAATFYTLIGSCFLQGVQPEAYLRDILPRCSIIPSTASTN